MTLQKFLFAFTLLLVGFGTLTQDLKETSLTSQIQNVTLFLSGAQVFENATGQIPAGESVILLKGLSPYLEEKIIQVKRSNPSLGQFQHRGYSRRIEWRETGHTDRNRHMGSHLGTRSAAETFAAIRSQVPQI